MITKNLSYIFTGCNFKNIVILDCLFKQSRTADLNIFLLAFSMVYCIAPVAIGTYEIYLKILNVRTPHIPKHRRFINFGENLLV